PEGVFCCASARSISPVERAAIPSFVASNPLCVPLPLPGAPRKRITRGRAAADGPRDDIALPVDNKNRRGLNRGGVGSLSGPDRTTLWYSRSHMVLDLVNGLRGDLGMRRIGGGMARLNEYWAKSGRLDPRHQDAAALLCYIAQWVDAGWRDVDVVQ